MNFLWTDSLTQPCFPSLDGDKQTDVLIIGGGMAKGTMSITFSSKASE